MGMWDFAGEGGIFGDCIFWRSWLSAKICIWLGIFHQTGFGVHALFSVEKEFVASCVRSSRSLQSTSSSYCLTPLWVWVRNKAARSTHFFNALSLAAKRLTKHKILKKEGNALLARHCHVRGIPLLIRLQIHSGRPAQSLSGETCKVVLNEIFFGVLSFCI